MKLNEKGMTLVEMLPAVTILGRAVAWSSGLQFTVERASKSLIGSAASGEGLVNVYKGTGKVLMSPV